MKIKSLLLICASALLVMGCNTTKNNNNNQGQQQGGGDQGGGDQGGGGQGGGGDQGGGGSQEPVKVVVPAHTLSDSNPPFDIYDSGEQVSESVWNSFKNGGASKFNNHFNFKYTAFHSANSYQQQFFTKNGYALKSLQGNTYSSMYYERKSGNTFYQYLDVPDGWLRQETTYNLTQTFTNRFADEVRLHMFEFSNYTWNEDFEAYQYNGGTFTSTVEFKRGYLSSLIYRVGSEYFNIDAMFDTTIEIPKSYYYQ